MLRSWLLLALVLISFNAFAKLDSQVLKDELYKITSHSVKSKIYSLHIAANDFENMKPSELALNQRNLDKLLESKQLIASSTIEERETLKNDINKMFEEIYYTKNAKLNQAGVLHMPLGSNLIALISIPNIYYTDFDDCPGPFILFDAYTCFQFDHNTRSYLTKYIKKNYVPNLSSDYLGYFTIIHEYAHTLPEQLRLSPMDIFSGITNKDIKKDMNMIYHYNEVYSDLYAAIRLLQMGYTLQDLDQIIFMRDVSLYLYDDYYHYSSPYIKALKKIPSDKYMTISSIEETNTLIRTIFYSVINEKDTMDYKNFYPEQLEMKEKISDIARFVNSINKNTVINDDNLDFVLESFTNFIKRVYMSNRKFDLRFNKIND